MKVILLEDVVGAGAAGEVVEVKSGYARNKLLPSGIAIEANQANMKTLEHRRAKIAAKKAADREIAQALAVRLEGKQVDFVAKAGDTGKLFGSVTAHEIIEKLNETLGFELDRRKLLLNAPIKEVGMHDVKYRIYPEVEATVKVHVASDGAPVLPVAETLKDTYSDAELEDRDEDEDESEGNYVYDAEAEAAAEEAAAAEAEEAAADEAAADADATEDTDAAEEATDAAEAATEEADATATEALSEDASGEAGGDA